MSAKAQSYKIRIQDFEGEDVRSFYETHVMRVWNLNGKECLYRIVRVQQIIKQEGDAIEKRAAVRLADRNGVEFPVPLELNPTNRNTIIGIYGAKTRNWVGQIIALYPTTCEAFGRQQDCIRVRPYDPRTRTQRSKRADVRDLPQQQTERRPSEPAPPSEQSSGLELDLEGADYSATDTDEPPFGALETDGPMEIIR